VGKNELLVFIYYQLGEFNTCKKLLGDLLRVNSAHEGYLVILLACSHIIDPMPSHEVIRQHLRLGDSGFVLSSVWDSFDETQLAVLTTPKTCLGAGDLVIELQKVKDEYIGPQVQSAQFDLLTLTLLAGDSEEFANRLEKFVVGLLNKGVPSAFKILRRLCQADSTKKSLVEKLLERLNTTSSPDFSPVFKTFALMTLSAYHDFSKEFDKALELVEQAISITPTLIDLYVLKAKILKHSGNAAVSTDTWEFARKLDLADRYLNSKSVKAMLRVGQIEKARETIMLFAKDNDDQTKSNLNEMQCMWWEYELGKALALKGDKQGAMSTWKTTLKHYEDMAEDEFDFALYCLRKMTLRAYIDFLRFGQRLKSHKFYKRTLDALAQLEG
jgi:tetratricopeptide (TPR) repeat protein